MPYLVNREPLTPDRVRREEARVSRNMGLQAIPAFNAARPPAVRTRYRGRRSGRSERI